MFGNTFAASAKDAKRHAFLYKKSHFVLVLQFHLCAQMVVSFVPPTHRYASPTKDSTYHQRDQVSHQPVKRAQIATVLVHALDNHKSAGGSRFVDILQVITEEEERGRGSN
jgi:hypothetical protein